MGIIDGLIQSAGYAIPGAAAARGGYLQGEDEEKDKQRVEARQGLLDRITAAHEGAYANEANARADSLRNPIDDQIVYDNQGNPYNHSRRKGTLTRIPIEGANGENSSASGSSVAGQSLLDRIAPKSGIPDDAGADNDPSVEGGPGAQQDTSETPSASPKFGPRQPPPRTIRTNRGILQYNEKTRAFDTPVLDGDGKPAMPPGATKAQMFTDGQGNVFQYDGEKWQPAKDASGNPIPGKVPGATHGEAPEISSTRKDLSLLRSNEVRDEHQVGFAKSDLKGFDAQHSSRARLPLSQQKSAADSSVATQRTALQKALGDAETSYGRTKNSADSAFTILGRLRGGRQKDGSLPSPQTAPPADLATSLVQPSVDDVAPVQPGHPNGTASEKPPSTAASKRLAAPPDTAASPDTAAPADTGVATAPPGTLKAPPIDHVAAGTAFADAARKYKAVLANPAVPKDEAQKAYDAEVVSIAKRFGMMHEQ